MSNPKVIPPEETGGVPVKYWATELEDGAYRQACATARLPCIFKHLALMADAHTGFGVPVGSVLALKNAISPNAVGVDIGCGMCAWDSGINLGAIDVRKFMVALKENIPHGEGKDRKNTDNWLGHDRIKNYIKELEQNWQTTESWPNARNQIGTLGGGNHFIELQVDDSQNIWLMLHSGSRGFGAKVAKRFHHLAVQKCRQYHTKLSTEELAFLPTDSDEGQAYINELNVAQKYAYYNRLLMMIVAQELLKEQHFQSNPVKDIINIHHNYATIENHYGENVWVHRKGATLARQTTTGIIPGSMCTQSYIVEGRGNQESFNSCSHGAGRNFSRTTAKKRIKEGLDPSQSEQLGSIELYGTREAHDELGSAYKDIDVVMENQKDLVEIKTRLKPVAVLKG